MNIIRKITLRNCNISAKNVKDSVASLGEGETKPLLRVVGIATGYKPGQTDKGEYLLLLGEFSAVNLLTGAQFQSAKAILPNFIAENFAPVLERNGSAEFALEIGAQRNDSAVTGYVYTVRPLMESKASDRMAELIAIASKELPSLPAPVTSNAKAPKGKK